MHKFPLIEAYWASLDSERPSGDDPKRVALALQSFYNDLTQTVEQGYRNRWKTPLFKKVYPDVIKQIERLHDLSGELAAVVPTDEDSRLAELRTLDESLRRSTFQLQTEEQNFGLPVHPSPKLNQLNYLFQGWKRGLLEVESVEDFARLYERSIRQTQKELKQIIKTPNPKEGDAERTAIEKAVASVESMLLEAQAFLSQLRRSANDCEPHMEKLLQQGHTLGEAFEALEQCAPITDPCPFCGGQISLSGRCKSCTRRLPHLEAVEADEEGPQSEFLSKSCRALDLAVLAWESNPDDLEAWKELQKAVREFGGHVSEGRKSFDMLAAAQDRPIDADSRERKQEESLKKVGQLFQETLTLWSKFTQSSEPPGSPPQGWRDPLKEAEEILKELQEALQPEESDSPLP